jgi:hypothetical protein
MNKTKLTAAIAWMRRQPRAVLIPGALLLAILLLTAITSMHGGESAPTAPQPNAQSSAPQVAAAASAVPKPAAQPVVPQVPARAARAPTPASTSTASLSASTSTVRTAPAPAAVVAPDGVEAGHVEVITSQKDQFGSWAQVARAVESAAQTTFTTPASPGREPDWRVTYRAWIQLAAPASIVTLGVAEGAGWGEAQIDGQPVGSRLMAGHSETASMALQPGWHTLTVSAWREGWKRGPGIAVRVEVGDGTTPPATVTPWAVPVPTGAAAAASTAVPATAGNL